MKKFILLVLFSTLASCTVTEEYADDYSYPMYPHHRHHHHSYGDAYNHYYERGEKVIIETPSHPENNVHRHGENRHRH